jgi:hypothetical protein
MVSSPSSLGSSPQNSGSRYQPLSQSRKESASQTAAPSSSTYQSQPLQLSGSPPPLHPPVGPDGGDPDMKDGDAQQHVTCECGHEFDSKDEEADHAHRGYSVVDVTRPTIWPDKARLAQLKEDNADWPDVASKCDLQEEEWQAKSPEFIGQWSQTCLEAVQGDLDDANEKCLTTHDSKDNKRSSIHTTGAHQQELEMHGQTMGMRDLSGKFKCCEALAGLVLAQQIACATLGILREGEFAMVTGERQRSHADGCGEPQDNVVDVLHAPKGVPGGLFTTKCGITGHHPPGATGMIEMTHDQMIRRLVQLRLDEAGLPENMRHAVDNSRRDGGHFVTRFRGENPHAGPGCKDGGWRYLLFFSFYVPRSAVENGTDRGEGRNQFTDSIVTFFSEQDPVDTDNMVDELHAMTPQVLPWQRLVVRTQEAPRRRPRGTHGLTLAPGKQPTVKISTQSPLIARRHVYTAAAYDVASNCLEAYESAVLFTAADHHLTAEFEYRGCLAVGSLLASRRPDAIATGGQYSIRVVYEWPELGAQVTSMGGDKITDNVYSPNAAVLNIPAHVSGGIDQKPWRIYPTGYNTEGANFTNAMQAYTIYQTGRCSSLSPVEYPPGTLVGKRLKHRLIHEGCGHLARAVEGELANTRYVVQYMRGCSSPVVWLVTCSVISPFDEVTRPDVLEYGTTTYLYT